MYKKYFVVIIIIMLILMACANEDQQDELQSFHFLLPGEATTFDPNYSNETYGTAVLHQMFEGLVKIDEDGQLINGSIQSYTVSEQNTLFTFTLRENLKWSDGEKVTAQQYKDAWLRFMDPDSTSNSASVISPYILNLAEYLNGNAGKEDVGIYVIDELTLQIKTKAPTPFLPDILTHNVFFPVRLDIIDGDEFWYKDPEKYVTNGPFTLKEYVEGSHITVVKNDYYWDAANIKLDEIKMSFRQDSDDIVAMYNNGQLDGLFEITAKELRNVPNSELSTNSKILPSTAFMTFNHDNELMSNQDFRKAISIAIDREGVVNEVLASAGIPSKFLVPIIYQIAGEPFREFTELDDGPQIEEAKAIIQQLKDDGIYDGRTITFHYMLNGPDAEVSEYIIEQLERDLEIDFEVIGMAWADLYDLALNKDYDFLMMGWGADYPHPMTFLTMFEKDSFYHPITRWRDLEYEDMLADFLLIEDEKEGLNLLRTIEDRILDGYHVVPIYYRKGLSLINEKVKGWHQGSTVFDFTRAYIEE